MSQSRPRSAAFGRLRGGRVVTLVLFLTVVALTAAAGAQDAQETSPETAQDPSALVAQAIAAHGGEEGLRKWENLEYEGEATSRFGPDETRGPLRAYVRDGTMLRVEMQTSFRGTIFETVTGSTGKSAWSRFRSRVYDLPPDNPTTALRHRPNLLLRAAAAPDEALRLGGRSDIAGDPVVVVDFTEATGSIRLQLDAESSLVRAIEYRAADVGGNGTSEEVLYKYLYGDYRPVDGVPFPHRIETLEDGVSQGAIEIERVVLGQAPDLELFARPQPDPESREWFDQVAY